MRKVAIMRRAVIAVLAAALLSTAAITPADATSWGDSGSGSSGVGTSGGGGLGAVNATCGQNIGQTPGVLYYKTGSTYKRLADYSWPNCVSPYKRDSWPTSGYTALHESGFLVYRFYGTYENPTKAVTRSRLNLTSWGADEPNYQFAPVWGLDTGSKSTPAGYTRGTNSQMKNDGFSTQDSYWLRNAAGQLTPAYPKLIKGKCQSLQTNGILRDWYNKTASNQEKIAVRATLGRVYWLASREGRYPVTGLAEAGLRKIESGYRFKWSDWKKDTTKAPERNAKGDSYYVTKFTWETRDCASPMLFAGEQSTTAEKRPVIGSCYIQTKRKTVSRRNSAGRTVLIWNSLTNPDVSAGERLSDLYKGKKYTPGGSGGDGTEASITGLSTAKQKKLIGSWRTFMENDIKSWHKSLGGFTNSKGTQIIPANPYTGDLVKNKIPNANTTSINKAASSLKNSARCRITTTALFDIPNKPAGKPPAVTVPLTVTNQEVHQVSANESVIRIDPGAPQCGSKACGKDIKLKSLTWTTKLEGTGKYNLCKASKITDPIPVKCDAIYVQTSGKNTISRTETFRLRFAAPTKPKDVVRVSISNARGTFEYGTTTQGLKIEGVDPLTGKKYTVDSGALNSTSTHSVTVTATGKPTALVKTSSGWTFQAPVISAIQVPR